MKTKSSSFAKYYRAALLLILAVFTTLILTSCSVFNYIFKTSEDEKPTVTSVSISADDGLDTDGNAYRATLGEEFTIKADVNDGAPSAITYVWSVGKSGETAQTIANESGAQLTFVLEEYFAEGYTFYVKANDVSCSQPIKIYTDYAGLSGVSITSESDKIIDGIIQRKIVETAQIELCANWNSTYMDPLKVSSCTVEWRVGDSPTVVSTEIDFSLSLPSAVGDTTVSLTVKDGEKSLYATVTVTIVERFFAVDKVSLSLNSGATSDGKGQYVQTSLSPELSFSTVTLFAEVLPLGTDNDAEVIWTLRNRNGISVLDDSDRELSFTPSYGENYLTATIGNVVSRQLNVIALTTAEYDDHRAEIDDVFVWEGGIFNHYISDQTDLNALVCYIISRHETATDSSDPGAHAMYIAKSDWKDAGGNSTPAFAEAINTAMSCSDESGYFPFNYSTNVIYIVPSANSLDAAFGNPTVNYPSEYTVNQYENVLTHFSTSSEIRTALPADSFTDTLTVTTSDQLFRALGWGYKPVFENNSTGIKLQSLYNIARNVLLDIIDDDMSDFEKVRAICEWISQEVDYDYSAAESTAAIGQKVTYDAFYLEGVFNDKKAVCDGRSKAFVLLCGMEGIKAIRITGKAITPQSSTPVGHAWNKVLLDVNDLGVKEWYLVDTTWSDRGMSLLSNEKSELLTMQYFLVTDAYTASTHDAESEYDPVANTTFNYYPLVTVENGSNDFDLYIDSDYELKNAVLYSRTQGVRLDIKVAPSVASSETVLKEKIGLILTANGGGTRILVVLDDNGGYYNLYITP